MIVRFTLLVLLITVKVFTALAQPVTFFQGNTQVTILEGGVLFIGGNYETQQTVGNDGTVIITGDLTNYSNNRIFESESGRVILSGSTDQNISENSWRFNNLILQKSSGQVFLQSDIQVDSSLQFISGNLYLDTFDIDLTHKGFLSGESEASRIYATTGAVRVKKVISFPKETENISGIGIFIHAPTENFGTTEILRAHASITNAGNGSITRTFYIKTTAVVAPEKIIIEYFDNDNISVESSLLFYGGKTPFNTYFPYGGQVNIDSNKVSSTLFTSLEEHIITLSEITENNTCLSSNPNYVESIFLLPAEAYEQDTIYLINLSMPHPDSVNTRWELGNGHIFNNEDIKYVFTDSGHYNISLYVNNSFCSDALTKQIHIKKSGVKSNNNIVITEVLNSFVFFPNPVSGELQWNIDLQGTFESKLSILDLFGRTVFEKGYEHRHIYDYGDLSYLTNGVYVLVYEVMGKVYTYRLVKI